MGVWIETRLPRVLLQNPQVTPCMGVWIETLSAKHIAFRILSHPVWVCGLKQETTGLKYDNYRHTLYGCVDWNPLYLWQLNYWLVTPCMGVWIETFDFPEHLNEETSHPVWVCGLKRTFANVYKMIVMSHPVWVCGLKHENSVKSRQ